MKGHPEISWTPCSKTDRYSSPSPGSAHDLHHFPFSFPCSVHTFQHQPVPAVHLQPHHGADEVSTLQVIVLVPLDALLVPTPRWVIHQPQLCHILEKKNANFKLFPQWVWAMITFLNTFSSVFCYLNTLIHSESTSKWRLLNYHSVF